MMAKPASYSGPSVLLLSLLLLSWMLDAAPSSKRTNDQRSDNTSNTTRSVSKRDYLSLPPNLGPEHAAGTYWLETDGDVLIRNSIPGHQRTKLSKDLARRAWELLERRNRPDAVAARREAVERRRAERLTKARGAPRFPSMEEKPFRQTALYSTSQMFKLLGPRNYDMSYTRIVQPREAREYPKGRVVFPGRSARKVPKSIRAVVRRFAHLLYDRHSRRIYQRMSRLDRKTRRNLRKFLAFYTACPVKYQWEDYGARFWPRWIKTGRCYETGRSCSIPPGMRCQPHRQKPVTLLRYICLESWKPEQCGWKIMNFPILLSCKCGCYQSDT